MDPAQPVIERAAALEERDASAMSLAEAIAILRRHGKELPVGLDPDRMAELSAEGSEGPSRPPLREGEIPPERWVIERPSDSSDYLDGPPPRYPGEPGYGGAAGKESDDD